MTKLEELKAAYRTAYDAYSAYQSANDDTNVTLMRAAYAAHTAYMAERRKTNGPML